MNTEQITEVNPFEIRFLIRRSRDAEGFKLLKASIKDMGIQQPLHVRTVPEDKRRRPDGGLYKWEALFGEGRTTACMELYRETKDKRFLKVPAMIKQIEEGEIVGRFLSENILRRDHPWLDQANLIKVEIDEAERAGRKANLKEIAKIYFITEKHAAKLLGILKASSPRIAGYLKELNLKQAETLTSLSKKGQEIVLETLAETDLGKGQLETVVKKAHRQLKETGQLSKLALKASIRRVNEDLAEVRKGLKVYRLHHSLGVENLKLLLSDKKFRAEIDRVGINYSKFLAGVKS